LALRCRRRLGFALASRVRSTTTRSQTLARRAACRETCRSIAGLPPNDPLRMHVAMPVRLQVALLPKGLALPPRELLYLEDDRTRYRTGGQRTPRDALRRARPAERRGGGAAVFGPEPRPRVEPYVTRTRHGASARSRDERSGCALARRALRTTRGFPDGRASRQAGGAPALFAALRRAFSARSRNGAANASTASSRPVTANQAWAS
jgi:hypothetical protein